MANINVLAPFILSWEGGFVNDKYDHGGATNKGVTLNTWLQCGYDKDGDGDIDIKDLKLISDEDVVKRVMKPFYWDRCRADEIQSQAVANMLVDWAWHSGTRTAIKAVQRLLNTMPDGILGPITLRAINEANKFDLFCQLKTARRVFIGNIIQRDPSQERFRKGWMRRINSIDYETLTYNDGEVVAFTTVSAPDWEL